MQFRQPITRGAFAALFFAGASLLAAPAHAQLVTNGGFEDAGSPMSSNYFYGWTLSGNADDTSTPPNTFVFGNSHFGDLAAWLGAPTTDGFLSQTLATDPGKAYTISYWLAVDGSTGTPTPNDLSASFCGQSLFSAANLAATDSHAAAADDYTLCPFTAVATSASSVLQFGFRDDHSEFRLDDVSVAPAAVPEASTTISFGLLLALGLGAAAWKVRRPVKSE